MYFRIQVYLFKTNVQLGASYTVGKLSTARYDAAFQAAADFINAPVDGVGLGASATQLLRNLSFTFRFKPGDEIVVSAACHESNIAPWLDLADRQSLVIRWWSPSPSLNPKLTPSNLAWLLTDRTRLVTFGHSSNILGSIHDVKGIASLVRAKCPEALTVCDGVSYAPHRPIDIQDLGVDFYVFSWYKVNPPCNLSSGSQGSDQTTRSSGLISASSTAAKRASPVWLPLATTSTLT